MSRTRIVAVDDDRRILRVLERACESAGYDVHSVLDGEFFESALRVFEPELVFLDLNMRGIDGMELLRFIAAERSDTHVVITHGVDERSLGAAHSLGQSLGLRMLDPIRKPLTIADVRRRLQTFRDRFCGAPYVAPQPPDEITREELARALSHGRVDVCYQPMVNLTTGGVVCAEALARLHRPSGEVVLPDRFIPVAERTGLIDALTFVVLERALGHLARWQAAETGIQVSVNVSPRLLVDTSLPERVGDLLAATGARPEDLVLEVTETALPDDRQRMADTLTRLRQKGIRLALDDFGSGDFSMGRLEVFPYETLKLDKEFAMRAERHDDAAAMIRKSLDLARSVGLTVVAEGIQSEEILRWLGRLGCDVGQGFHISPPLTAGKFCDWLARTPRERAGRLGEPRVHAVG